MFKDKAVLVTGGNSGIGAAAARIFARQGARVAVATRRLVASQAVVEEIRAAGGEAIAIAADVAEMDQVQAMVEQIVQTFGRIDVAFNNAGHTGDNTTLVDCTPEAWDTCFNVNVRGLWLCMKYEIPHMLRQGGGAIVNTSSGLAEFSSPRMAAYTAAKHAANGLTISAALDYAPHNIRVNSIMPGATLTPMLQGLDPKKHVPLDDMRSKIPLRRIASPEEMAEAAVWLASDQASYVTGVNLMVDGGLKVKRW